MFLRILLIPAPQSLEEKFPKMPNKWMKLDQIRTKTSFRIHSSTELDHFLHPVVQRDVAIFVFDPESSVGVASFLSAVSVDCLHCAIWILPPLVVSRVDLLLARVEKYLLGAVPWKNGTFLHPAVVWSRLQFETWLERAKAKIPAQFPPDIWLNQNVQDLRVDLDKGPIYQHALLPPIREQVLHRLVWKRDFLATVWKMLFWSRHERKQRRLYQIRTVVTEHCAFGSLHSSAPTCLVVGEVQDLHAVWVGDVSSLGIGIIVDLSTKPKQTVICNNGAVHLFFSWTVWIQLLYGVNQVSPLSGQLWSVWCLRWRRWPSPSVHLQTPPFWSRWGRRWGDRHQPERSLSETIGYYVS